MKTNKALVRASAAALAIAVGLGGFGFQPYAAQAAEPGAFSQATFSLANLNDPARLALIDLNSKKESVLSLTESYGHDPSSYRYHDLIALQDKAYTAAFDLGASETELLALKQDYEKALNDYIDFYIKDRDIIDLFDTLEYLLYYHYRIDQDESKLTPAERAQLHAIWDAYDYLDQSGTGTTRNYMQAYKEVYLPKFVKAQELYAYDSAFYTGLASKYRADIQARLNGLGGDAGRYSASVKAFEQVASLLEESVNGSRNNNQVQMARGNLEVVYKKLQTELDSGYTPLPQDAKQQLQAQIDSAWKLMDKPKGIRSGETPQSAFGDLRRAIRKAEAALEKAQTGEELTAARQDLAAAVSVFESRRKP